MSAVAYQFNMSGEAWKEFCREAQAAALSGDKKSACGVSYIIKSRPERSGGDAGNQPVNFP